MYALRISLNGQAVVVAGGPNLELLTTSIIGLGKPTNVDSTTAVSETDFTLRVGGIVGQATTSRHAEWLEPTALKCGDLIAIEVIDVERADSPIHGEPADFGEAQRVYFEHCRDVYLEQRDRFEAGPNDGAGD